MIVIAIVMSVFVATIGAVTFHESALKKASERDSEDFQLSCIMVLVGVFCLTFNLADATSALTASVFVGIALFVVYELIAYTAGAYTFATGKMHRNVPSCQKDESCESADKR